MADRPGEDLEQHVHVLSILTLVLGIFQVAMTALVVLGLTVMAWLLPVATTDDALRRAQVTFAVVVLIVVIVGAIGVLGIFAARDLMARRSRGRTLTIVYGAVNLMSFPIGTAYGVYAIWTLTRPGIEDRLHD